MNKKLYQSSVDRIKFDEQLEYKTVDYINKKIYEERNKTMNNNRFKWNLKISASTTVAACTICILSATAYAAVTNTNKIEYTKNGFISKSNREINDELVNENESVEISNTSEIRDRMENDKPGIELISEEKGNSKSNWIKKSTFRDNTKSYISEDTINWDVDKEDPTEIITEYIYKSYDMAIKDAGFPNIIEKVFCESSMNKDTFLKEYSTKESSNITRKSVIGNFNYKKGKVSIDLSKLSTESEMIGNEYSVITDIEKTTNQREYNSKDGIEYKLSNSGDNKTTTIINSGSYLLMIQFECLSENEIYTILDKLDVSSLY